MQSMNLVTKISKLLRRVSPMRVYSKPFIPRQKDGLASTEGIKEQKNSFFANDV